MNPAVGCSSYFLWLPISRIAATIHVGGTGSLQEMKMCGLTRNNPMRVCASIAQQIIER
jgi:hypothetical protein